MRIVSLAAVTAMLVLSLAAIAYAGDSRQITLNVYAWAEYFPPSVVSRFQTETGIHVNYAVFDSPDAAETALSAGSSNYDIVTMNAVPHLAREIPQGFWKKLDATQIPNARNADPQILKLMEQVDPGNTHAVPWMWGTTGVIYNADKVKALMGEIPANGLDMVLKKENAEKFERCGIRRWRFVPCQLLFGRCHDCAPNGQGGKHACRG